MNERLSRPVKSVRFVVLINKLPLIPFNPISGAREVMLSPDMVTSPGKVVHPGYSVRKVLTVPWEFITSIDGHCACTNLANKTRMTMEINDFVMVL